MRTFMILAMATMLSFTSNAQSRGGGRSFSSSRSATVNRSYSGGGGRNYVSRGPVYSGSRNVSNYRGGGGYRGGYNYGSYNRGFRVGFGGPVYYGPSYYSCDPYYDSYCADSYYDYAQPRTVVRTVVVPNSRYAPAPVYVEDGRWRRFGN